MCKTIKDQVRWDSVRDLPNEGGFCQSSPEQRYSKVLGVPAWPVWCARDMLLCRHDVSALIRRARKGLEAQRAQAKCRACDAKGAAPRAPAAGAPNPACLLRMLCCAVQVVEKYGKLDILVGLGWQAAQHLVHHARLFSVHSAVQRVGSLLAERDALLALAPQHAH